MLQSRTLELYSVSPFEKVNDKIFPSGSSAYRLRSIGSNGVLRIGIIEMIGGEFTNEISEDSLPSSERHIVPEQLDPSGHPQIEHKGVNCPLSQ